MFTLFEELGQPRHVVLEVVTKHFRKCANQHLLTQGLKVSLGFDSSASVDSVKQKFVVAPNHEKHLIVCLVLSDILCPIAPDSPNALTILMKRLMTASECVNMAI